MVSSYFVKNLSKFIRICNMQSTNISIEPYGNISITARFDSNSDLKISKQSQNQSFLMFRDLFIWFKTNFSGINIFAHETENTSTQVTPN